MRDLASSRSCRARVAAFIAASTALCASATAQDVDLAAKYPATLDWTVRAIPRPWTCERQDVWRLRSFTFDLGEGLNFKLGPTTLVFGHNAGNVVWAALFPDQPAPLRSPAVPEGEKIKNVWLRFHPDRVGVLFPRETVESAGPAETTVWAKRLCQWKLSASWQVGYQPRIPRRDSMTVDIDTTSRVRRFFSVNTDSKHAEYVAAFAQRPLPPLAALDPATAAEIFDQVWKAFDAEYPLFGIKPSVDWNELRKTRRPRALAAESGYELAAVIADMLAKLDDLHVWVRVGDEALPVPRRERLLNGSYAATRGIVGKLRDEKKEGLLWGRSEDRIGYLNIRTLAIHELAHKFDRAIESLGDSWALVIDLRYNGGGDEKQGKHIAGRFMDEQRVYSKNRYRNGPNHADLGPVLSRSVAPTGQWQFKRPVVVLIGPRTMSSAESLALMLAQNPHVTTMGAPTAGASANPRLLELPLDIAVNLPRWLDLTPDGTPLETTGVRPDILIQAKQEEFTLTADPVLSAAFKHLRQQPVSERQQAKPR